MLFNLGNRFALGVALCAFGLSATVSMAADAPTLNMIDPTPVSQQKPAVDGWNFKASAVSGVLGGYSNHMFLTSVTAPMPFIDAMGIQLDLGIGNYRHDYTSAASGLHIFARDPDRGMFGIYGDWGYVDNEHGGRVGAEFSFYQDRWSLDGLVAVQFGQHFLTKVVDEVDLSYYVTDNFRASIGHRLISRGHVGNVGIEWAPDSNNGWSVYAEAEAGQDDYKGAWAGIRYAFGSSAGKTLIDRDRQSDPKVRIPRNLASLTQCGELPPENYIPEDWWHSTTRHLCGSKDDIFSRGGSINKLKGGN